MLTTLLLVTGTPAMTLSEHKCSFSHLFGFLKITEPSDNPMIQLETKSTLEFTSERMGGTMTRLEKLVKIPRYFDFDSLGYLLGNTCAGYTP